MQASDLGCYGSSEEGARRAIGRTRPAGRPEVGTRPGSTQGSERPGRRAATPQRSRCAIRLVDVSGHANADSRSYTSSRCTSSTRSESCSIEPDSRRSASNGFLSVRCSGPRLRCESATTARSRSFASKQELPATPSRDELIHKLLDDCRFLGTKAAHFRGGPHRYSSLW